jgi:hypothetical protein
MHNAAHSLHLAYSCLKGPYHKIFKPILEYSTCVCMHNAAHSLHLACSMFLFKRAASQDLNLSLTSYASVQHTCVYVQDSAHSLNSSIFKPDYQFLKYASTIPF